MTPGVFLVVLVVAILLLMLLIIKLKVHPVMALFTVALLTGIVLGFGVSGTADMIGSGFGSTLGSVGITIILGAIISMAIEDTGAAKAIANFFIKLFRGKNMELAPALTAFIMSIPVFGDITMVLTAPIASMLSKRKHISMSTMASFTGLGLFLTHGLVPPTPGILAIALMFEADLGMTIVWGIVIALIGFFVTWLLIKRWTEKEWIEPNPEMVKGMAESHSDNIDDILIKDANLPNTFLAFLPLLLPVALAVTGIICSIIGSFLVKTKENATQQSLLKSLRTGTYTAAVLSAILAAPLTYFILDGHMGVYVAILCGLIGGCAIGYFTEYYTSDTYKPTQELAAASETGSATIIIGGISLGLKSTLTSILIVAAAVLVSYFAAGGSMEIVDEAGAFTAAFNQGLYGIGIAGVGMLSTLGITLATDAYGPVADNAGGIAEMSGLPESVRERTDALDSLGNTTAATGKGFAIGSASLTALALLVSYVNIVQENTEEMLNFTLTSPTVLVGMFIGAMLTFVFSAFTMSAVQKAAQSIVVEVRRQFKEIAGIMEYKADPDYASCVSLCTKGALHEMVVPALLAIIVPILTGLILGPTGVVGLLGGVSVTGFAMAVFMSNAGGAWDNAKKYIERGNHGGKGSEQHKAAVVGDTVGDPFKDTSGPSLNILIKLCSTVSIVFSGLITSIHLLG